VQLTRRRTCDDARSEDSFVVGSTVSFVLCDITGVIVDLVLDEDFTFIQYAIIAFDTGPGEPPALTSCQKNCMQTPCSTAET
jgi:hypothetical protein